MTQNNNNKIFSYRKFKFNLKRHRSLFSENFRVVSVDAGGREETIDFDPTLYHGTLEGLCGPMTFVLVGRLCVFK